MNIVKATQRFEDWLGQHTRIVRPDLRLKHERMSESPFSFLRATFYRWVQVWPEVCSELEHAPHILAVGDLHVENFGTWRDTDGRLVWGVNDFDEASLFPYALDLVRLATSAIVAAREQRLAMNPNQSTAAILDGYQQGLQEGGRPFVLEEGHGWLRSIAESKLRDPVVFWRKMDRLPTLRGEVPESAREAIEHMLPQLGLRYRLARRVAGLGSLGHARLVAIADWKGGRVAREAKALVPSCLHWLNPRTPVDLLYSAVMRQAVRCPDPYVQLRGHWIVRRLSPHCSRIELDALGSSRGELRLLEAMGRETANIHLGTEEKRRRAILKDLRQRKGNWLLRAAQAMASATEKDWQTWRKRSRT